jgi:hypothetical protein
MNGVELEEKSRTGGQFYRKVDFLSMKVLHSDAAVVEWVDSLVSQNCTGMH